MSKLTKKERIFRHIEENGNKMRRTDIVKFILSINRPGQPYDHRYHRGYYSVGFQPGVGHLMKGGKAHLCQNADRSYSVYRLINGVWKKTETENEPIRVGVKLLDEIFKLGSPMHSLPEFFGRLSSQSETPEPIAFVSPERYRELNEINLQKIANFVENFNIYIKEGELILNTGLDDIPQLNKKEFEVASKIAADNGWFLTSFDDNYQTVSYKLTPKE